MMPAVNWKCVCVFVCVCVCVCESLSGEMDSAMWAHCEGSEQSSRPRTADNCGMDERVEG